ncbi:HD domain-containing protein [Brachyspira murdochii]|uniref:HD domain-containing protein n=1 Tax=Brachyspira murdochii TaxID=84378 RepID=UPI0021587078|nr:HD domain-containing protein [Brachyspira murdochii]
MSIAALLHDITLTETMNYLPIENSNNELYSHAIKSYNYLKYSISNNQDVNLAVGLHHEYYGYGYGFAITLCEAMRVKRPNFKYQYLITFDSKDILNFTSSVYYPVKILEILDLYDFLKYKRDICFNEINTDDDIINYMYDNFLKDEVKIDYILFTIFKKYLLEMKTFD